MIPYMDAMLWLWDCFSIPHKKGSLHIEPEKSVGGFLMVRVKGGWKDSDMNSKNNK